MTIGEKIHYPEAGYSTFLFCVCVKTERDRQAELLFIRLKTQVTVTTLNNIVIPAQRLTPLLSVFVLNVDTFWGEFPVRARTHARLCERERVIFIELKTHVTVTILMCSY